MADTDNSSYILRYNIVSQAPEYFVGSDWYTLSLPPGDIPLANGKLLVGSAGGLAAPVSLSGDATLINTGTLTLANTAVTPAAYTLTSLTVDSKGRLTAASSATTTGSGSVVLATSPTLVTPALGTPTTLVGTNITGTAAGLTAGTVTTNANLTGGVTSVGNATTVVTNANLTGPVTSVGNATSLASTTGSGAIVLATSPTLVTPALGTPTALVGTNITGTAAGLTAGTVTTNANLTGGVTSVGNAATVVTNANLTGVITSVGNATSIASQTGTGTKFVVDTSPTLVTPIIGAATATSVTFSPTTGGIVGTTTNDSPSAGKVGEYITSSVSNISGPASTHYGDITSIILTAGDWDVSYIAEMYNTTYSAVTSGVGTVTGDSGTGLNPANSGTCTGLVTTDFTMMMGGYQVSIGSTTTFYLKLNPTYAAGTSKLQGRLSGRRMR